MAVVLSDTEDETVPCAASSRSRPLLKQEGGVGDAQSQHLPLVAATEHPEKSSTRSDVGSDDADAPALALASLDSQSPDATHAGEFTGLASDLHSADDSDADTVKDDDSPRERDAEAPEGDAVAIEDVPLLESSGGVLEPMGAGRPPQAESLALNSTGFFDQFEFGGPEAVSPRLPARPLADKRRDKAAWRVEVLTPATPQTPSPSSSRKRPREHSKAAPSEDFAAMPAAERARIAAKWRSFAPEVCDAGATRFQMLVAAILHAKATEAVVRSAMARLQRAAASGASPSALTPAWLEAVNEEALVALLDGIHWHKVKARRLIAASAMVASLWSSGAMPRLSCKELMAIPGVGPKLAVVLEFAFEFAVADDFANELGNEQLD